MRYCVLDNNMYANSRVHTKLKGKGWDTCVFDTLMEAIEYADKWLGKAYGPFPRNPVILNRPYDYSGCNDTIEIREVSKD